MKGFAVYPTYRIIEDKAYVMLFGRLENNDSFLTITKFKPYFYIQKYDLENASALADFKYEETEMRNFNGKLVIKIILNLPQDVPKLRNKFEENNIKCYEADIKFAYRFMFDHNVQGSLEINGDYEQGQNVDRIYRNPEIKFVEYFPKNLKVLAIDIESSKESGEIYCISLVCNELKKVLINSNNKLKNAVNCKNEEELLEKFVNEVNSLDPDIITGWNVIDFDLHELFKRCKKLNVELNISRDNSSPKLKIEDNFFRDSKCDIPGRQVLDALNLLRGSFVKVSDYKLDTVANQILGEKKLIQFKDKSKEIEELFKNNQQKLVDYNLKDSELVIKILEKTKIIDLTILRSSLTGMPLDRVNASIASFDSLYIRETIKRKLVVPSGKFIVKEEGIKGGFVKESLPGIYDYILVLDFKSLYPSMMRTFNIDPYSYVPDCKGKNLIKAPNGACFRNDNGILPEILTRFYHEREKARKEKDELTKYAIKILSNSFFGLLANPSCRFFDINLANAITYFGQHIIQLTAQEIEKLGYKWIYSDTDSIFLVSNAKSLEEADKIGEEIEKYINDFYKSYIKKEYNRESFLELNYDKCFVKCLMPKLRKSETGAKKRYAGLVMKDGKETIQFTGLEFVRGDWTELAKKFQYELLDKVFHNKEVADYIKNFVKDLESRKFDELLVYKKNMRKGINDYAVETPHKKAAKKLLAEGKALESNIISYIMTEDGPEPLGHLKHKINYKHYIEKQIKPLADSILIFFSTDFETLIKGNKQVSLFDY